MQQSRSDPCWRELLAFPARASHILQLYESEDFLAAAVAHYAAEGLSRGEAVLLNGTREHLARIRKALGSADADVDGAARNGQLTTFDVHEAVALAAGGALDRERFEAIACGALESALGDPRFTGARWWGEITNTLHYRGDPQPGLEAERLADVAAKKYGVTLFCSFLCDKYDARGYDSALKDLCCVHSDVIPADDYASHRRAVNRAIREVVGELRGPLLQSLASWQGMDCRLPCSQALLFWLREALPDRFEAVLRRARELTR